MSARFCVFVRYAAPRLAQFGLWRSSVFTDRAQAEMLVHAAKRDGDEAWIEVAA